MTESDLPAFIRDSLEDEAATDDELLSSLAHLAEVLPPVQPGSGATRTLLAAVEKMPLRYAPFYARVAALLDVDEGTVEALLARASDQALWRWGGLPGVQTLDVKGGPSVRDAHAFFIRFSPGARLPEHRHEGDEQVLILEGGYREYSGKTFEAGDLHKMAAGSTHGFLVFPDQPCVALAVYHGHLRFSSLPLRWLAKLMGR